MEDLSSQQLELIQYGINILKPKPIFTGSQWADEYFHLSTESSSIPGKWKTRPWQIAILDAMTDQITPIVVFQKPTRVGYTKMLGATSGFYIHQRPSVQLHYQPNADEAKGFAEDEFEPMVRDNKCISELIETPNIRGRNKREKTIKKIYPGGYAEFLGAESDRNFNRRTARVVSGDELDTWKKEAGKAGDTVTTMMRRTSDFWDRKNILGGKPMGAPYNPDESIDLDDGISVVNYWYKKGTQEQRYLPCPHCGHYHLFTFYDLKWDKDKDEDGNTIKHYPETAHFKCNKCNKKIFDKHKRAMDKKGKWVAHNPKAFKDGIRSFHIWAMLSYSPNVTWTDIVKEFLDSKDNRLKFKTFCNEVLAETWEEDYTQTKIDDYENKKEIYKATVPKEVRILTAGVDTQDDRFEIEVVGWGAHEESWSIDFHIIQGDPNEPETRKKLDEYLLKTFDVEGGGFMKIYAAAIDRGGHRSKAVDQFGKNKLTRKIFIVFGGTEVKAPPIPLRATKSKYAASIYKLGVNALKDDIHAKITSEEKGPNFMHFPKKAIYNAEYFKQLSGEKRLKDGRWIPKRARVEALDCRVYSLGALLLSGIDVNKLIEKNIKAGFIIDEIEKPKIAKKRRRIISKGVN